MSSYPRDSFPVQDTGVILGISEGPQNVSFTAMAEQQQALADVILKDPDVASLSSFIGIDGTNATPNSGRIQINLKPRDERNATATDIIRRLQPELAKVEGITLYMQPVQDLTVEDRVSRTQYQVHAGRCRRQGTADLGAAVWSTELRTLPQLRDVASDQQNQGLESRSGDRSRYRVASRHSAAGHRRHALRRLRPAPGLDHLHPAESVSRGAGSGPAVPAESGFSENILREIDERATQVPLSSFSHFETSNAPLAINHQGQFPVGDLVLQSGAGSLAGRGHQGHRASGTGNSACRQHSYQLPGNRGGVPAIRFHPSPG